MGEMCSVIALEAELGIEITHEEGFTSFRQIDTRVVQVLHDLLGEVAYWAKVGRQVDAAEEKISTVRLDSYAQHSASNGFAAKVDVRCAARMKMLLVEA